MALGKGTRTQTATKNVRPVATTANKAVNVNTTAKNTVKNSVTPTTANKAVNVNTTTKNTVSTPTTTNKAVNTNTTVKNTAPVQSTPVASTPAVTTPTYTPVVSTPAVSTPAVTAPTNYYYTGSGNAYAVNTGGTGKGVNSDILKNVKPVTTPTTPVVSTPTASSGLNISAPTSDVNVGNAAAKGSGLVGTAINPANLIATSIERQLEEQNQQLLDNHALDQMAARANETPSETTNRYLNLLSSVTGATGNASRPYSNPNYSFNTSKNTGYTYAKDKTLEELVADSVYDSLVGEVGSSAPFVEVPAYNLNNAGLAINGPTAVVQNPGPTIGETVNDYISRRLGELGLTPTTNNPIEAAMTGTVLDPYATSPTKSSFNGDISNKYSADNPGNGGSGGTGGDGYGYGTNGIDGIDGLDGLNIGTGYDLSSLYDLLNQQLNEYNLEYNNLMNSLMSAYGLNNQNLDAYYQSVLDALGSNYADTENLLNGQLSTSQQALEDDRRRALQEAYISRMMQEKALADQLDAYGLSGGASESVMADLRNNYMNNRASVEEKTQNSLKDLLQAYLGNMSDARQRYNQNLMNAQQNRLNAQQNYANNLAESQANAASYLANARSGAYQNLFNTLAKLYTA